MISNRTPSPDQSGNAQQAVQVLSHYKWKLLYALLPAGILPLIVVVLLASNVLQDLPVRFEYSLLGWAGLAGLVLSGLATVGLVVSARAEAAQRRAEAAQHRAIAKLQVQTAEYRHRFLENLSHELKNPLSALSADVETLATAEMISKRQQTLATVKARIERIRKIVIGLRTLNDLETRPLEKDRIDMADLIQQVVAEAKTYPSATDSRPSLHLLHGPWPLPAIVGDEVLLSLAIRNLIDNAFKYSQPTDAIEVRAHEDDRSLVIEVVDHGPGIPPEDQAHLWEEFYRGKTARAATNSVPGSGLGLALVRRVVIGHGGSVTLSSRLGQGTVFTIRLPVSDVAKS